MEHREPSRFGNDVFDWRQHTAQKRRIADISVFRAQDPQRHFISVCVEVTGDDHERIGISIEQLFYEHPSLKRLARTLHGCKEEALGPAAGRAPREWTELLTCDRRSKRRTQVQIDDMERCNPDRDLGM